MRQSRELTLTSGLLLILASLASAQPASSGKKADNQKLVPAGEILVKILAVNASDHSLQVELGRPSQRLTLQTTDDVKVRWYNLPVKYDDKGNPTRYTSSEIRQLQERGLPGYTADFDSLKAHFAYGLRVQFPFPFPANEPGKICRHVVGEQRASGKSKDVALNFSVRHRTESRLLQEMRHFVRDRKVRHARFFTRV